MRTYGQDESGKWVTIATDANGFNDAVYLTTLVQNLKLAPQESPFRESRHSCQRFGDPADYPHLLREPAAAAIQRPFFFTSDCTDRS